MDKSQWQSHVGAFKQSGLSARAYTDQHALVYHQFLYWCRKYTDSQASGEGFVPVTLASSTPSPAPLGVVEFPSGARLIIHSTECLAMLPQCLAR
jgi:hypothetical protein